MRTLKSWLAAGAAFALSAVASGASAEEGMWTFDAAPVAQINAELDTHVDQAWLDKVRLGAVRISGCSASLVSSEGLVLTNQHCVRSCAQTFSTPERDVVREGFFTTGREDERVCAGQTAEILLEIVDVTPRVSGAAAGKTGQAFVKARDAEIGLIEKEGCGTDAKLRCQVISLHRGGQYKLYKYRKYADVRLVYAPEAQAVVFGGDPDNFNFPRYALDAAFLRVYEDGKPAKTPNHLKWNPRAPKPGEPTFVAGNPGSTSRLKTVAQLDAERDWMLPATIKRLSELRGRLIRYAEESDDHRRQTRDALRGVENNLKRAYGMHQALATTSFMDAKRTEEAKFRAQVAADPALAATGDPWGEIAALQDDVAVLLPRYEQLETQAGQGSALYGYARTLVRAAQEKTKPNGERLLDYTEARLPLAEKRTLDPRRIEPELETLYLAFWLNKTREALGTDAPSVQTMLGKESPEAMAARMVAATKLGDPAVRAALWAGGLDAITASDDPLIQFVLKTDADARAARAAWEERVEGPTDRAAERLALARFKVYGDRVYPDATGSLRLSYGRIAGWKDGDREVAPTTNVAGLYERATGAAPFDLSAKFAERKAQLDPATIFTVATTNDIIGGNSGSPLIDAKGEVIGAVFDGNLPSLGGAYGYDGTTNRTVAVSAAMVQQALLKLYGQDHLVKELNAK
ncbi:S46 family peptidase [Caulobacter sp. 17J80-11]|uniref:S46 family peptidase n=1 Tax=Caulobacter sp. 17J80-11 TaxID=2763502 RepID=UPI00351C98E3